MSDVTPPRPPKPLNIRLERFCENVAEGMTAAEAYRRSNGKMNAKSAGRLAYKLKRKPEVQARIAELRSIQTGKALMSRDQKRELLAAIAQDPEAKAADRIRAMEVDARLAGHFEPDRTELEVGPVTLLSIRERANQVTSALVAKYMYRSAS